MALGCLQHMTSRAHQPAAFSLQDFGEMMGIVRALCSFRTF